MRTPKENYVRQKCMAKYRDIEWNLTFEEWWDLWEKSGNYDKRGRGIGTYCMSRIGDSGPYEIGNVFIQSNEQNSGDGHKGKKQSPELIAKRVAKIVGVKHSPERRLANSLGQLKSKTNVFVNHTYDCSNRIPWNKGR